MTFKVIKERLPIDEAKNDLKTSSKQDLFLQGRLRWNILINILVITVFVLPFFVPLLVTFILNAYFLLNWFLFLVIAIVKHFKILRTLKRHRITDEEKPKSIDSNYKFIMATFVYKEPIELIAKSLENITQIYGSESCLMIICLEEKTPDLEIKISKIKDNFEKDLCPISSINSYFLTNLGPIPVELISKQMLCPKAQTSKARIF